VSPTGVMEAGRVGPSKYALLVREMLERISQGRYPVGTRFPSVRKISTEFGVSPGTALKGIKELERQKLVVCHASGKGTIVARREPASSATRPTTLACLFRTLRPRNAMDNFGLDMIQGVQDAISGRGYRFVHHRVDEAAFEQRMLDLAQEDWVAGVVIDQLAPLSTMRRLAATGLPVALFNREEHVAGLSTVCPDYRAMGRETTRLARTRGYERLACCWNPDFETVTDESRLGSGWPMVEARRGFVMEAAALFAGEAVASLSDPPESPPPGPEAYGLPRRKPPDWRPLAVLATSDTRAQRLIEAVRQTNLVLGRDIGVVGMCDLEGPRHSSAPPSTWRVDPAGVGAAAVDELMRRIEDGGPEAHVRIRMEFVDRGTV